MARCLRMFLLISLSMFFSCVSPDNTGTGDYINTPGTRIHYLTSGKGTPLMIFHGSGTDGCAPLMDAYAKSGLKARLISFDKRGAGLSKSCVDSKNISGDNIRDAEELRMKLGIRKVNVLGHSTGCSDALEYARLYPENCGAVILVYPEKAISESADPVFSAGAREVTMPVLITAGGDEKEVLKLHDKLPNSILIIYGRGSGPVYPGKGTDFFGDIARFLNIYAADDN